MNFEETICCTLLLKDSSWEDIPHGIERVAKL